MIEFLAEIIIYGTLLGVALLASAFLLYLVVIFLMAWLS